MHIRKVAALYLAIGAACGSTGVCDKADQAARNLANAAAGCPQLSGADGGSSLSVSVSSKAACQAALSSCSSSDQDALSKVFDCISGMARCTPGQENQFIGQLLACAFTAGNISQQCQNALSHY
jgi:hypothetical protein